MRRKFYYFFQNHNGVKIKKIENPPMSVVKYLRQNFASCHPLFKNALSINCSLKTESSDRKKMLLGVFSFFSVVGTELREIAFQVFAFKEIFNKFIIHWMSVYKTMAFLQIAQVPRQETKKKVTFFSFFNTVLFSKDASV